MALYVGIREISETHKDATYEFGPNEAQVGRIQVLKPTGDMVVLSEVPGDETGAYASRAGRKLLLHWREGKYPDVTCWAS